MKTALKTTFALIGVLLAFIAIFAFGLWLLNNRTFLRWSAYVEAGYTIVIWGGLLLIVLLVSVDKCIKFMKRLHRKDDSI